MSVFRVERTRDYTVMSNHHLKNKVLSLKAKGLMSLILSLPDNWDYTLQGLAHISLEKIDAVRRAVKELECQGYIIRSRERDDQGKLRGTEYVIREQPISDLPALENPALDKPALDKPTLEKPTQLSNNKASIDKLNTDLSNTHSVPSHPADSGAGETEVNGIEKIVAYEQVIKENIAYDALCQRLDKSYNEAPFSIASGNEDVVLNSGAFQLTYSDLTLPGRNGFDLSLSRQYDSSKSNTEDINLYYDDETGDRYNCVVFFAKWQIHDNEMIIKYRVEDSYYFWKDRSDMLSEIRGSYDGDPEWMEDDGTFDDGRGYYQGMVWDTPWKTQVFMRTSTRPNDHFYKLYGLGYGWRLMFPSIERVVTQEYRTKTKTFLHLETGLSLPINEANNGFDDYPLKDVTIQYAGNIYTVFYKDGRTAYFDANNRLTRMTDKFGNQITFAYDAAGRMNRITGAPGRVAYKMDGIGGQSGAPIFSDTKVIGFHAYEVENPTSSSYNYGTKVTNALVSMAAS